jgi:hypothetical protein
MDGLGEEQIFSLREGGHNGRRECSDGMAPNPYNFSDISMLSIDDNVSSKPKE